MGYSKKICDIREESENEKSSNKMRGMRRGLGLIN